MKALLIVDVQNDFCPGGSLAVPEGDKVVPIINSLMSKFELVVASKDWHPEETVHFDKWPVHCVRDTHGSEFHPELNSSSINKVFLKGTDNKDDGYSAFEATNENLREYLNAKGVNELYVTGLATDYCVKASAIDSNKYGYKTYVVEDAIEGVEVTPGDVNLAKEEMRKENIVFISSGEI